MAGKKSSHRVLGSPLTIPDTQGHRSQMPLQFRQVTLQRQDVLFHHEDPEGPLIADWRLRISDLELMNSFSIGTIRNPQSEMSVRAELLFPTVIRYHAGNECRPRASKRLASGTERQGPSRRHPSGKKAR